MKWVNSIHCFVTNCTHRDNKSECCKKTDVTISEAGCLIYIKDKKKKAETEEKQTGKYINTEE